MKKIPTIFERDWNGDPSLVLDVPNPACAWVFAGEGHPTVKLDGTACMVRAGQLFKRREVKLTELTPMGFIEADHDNETGKTVGWVPVGMGPEDKYHREAFEGGLVWSDGTYELIGPKIQGNPEREPVHMLIKHSVELLGLVDHVPRSFTELRDWLTGKDTEGIVWHHPDGRMAKIKLRDFGLKRVPS